MLVPALLLALLVVMPASVPRPAPDAVRAAPDEPGAHVLPDAAILQVVAADLDGDGTRELVRLVRGDGDAVLAEVWADRGGTWELLGEPVEVVPPSRVGQRIDDVFAATPVRLLVRRVAGSERVTVASQPHFEEIDVGEPCCLLLHDLLIGPETGPRRVEVAEPSDFSDAILVIDLDGDGTDELLSTQSLPPAGDISFPTLARVFRWSGDAFGPPTESELRIGSGDSPFLLGDSDGLPGDEAAIISTLGPPGLYRIEAGAADHLTAQPAGFTADQAVAVPVGDGRGVAATGPAIGFGVARWPRGGPATAPVGTSQLSGVRLLGTVEVEGQPRLAAHREESTTLHLLELPGLEPWRETLIGRSPAAALLSAGPPAPFVGVIPGPDVASAGIAHAGRLVTPTTTRDGSSPPAMATLAGASPIGLVGTDGDLALLHAPLGPSAPGPGGGALVVPTVVPLAWTSVVPIDLVVRPEADLGAIDPEIAGALRLDGSNDLAVGSDGFEATVVAPPGSRVIPSAGTVMARSASVVPASGSLNVRLSASAADGSTDRRRIRLVVMTPAGHAYVASWDVEPRVDPPAVEAVASTRFGSSSVEVSGHTVRQAGVRIGGRPVEVDASGGFRASVEMPPWPTEVAIEVDDGLGNVARTTVVGVGLFDYRGLPWVPIVAMVVGVAALVLLLRVPRTGPFARRADDDAVLEELEPD